MVNPFAAPESRNASLLHSENALSSDDPAWAASEPQPPPPLLPPLPGSAPPPPAFPAAPGMPPDTQQPSDGLPTSMAAAWTSSTSHPSPPQRPAAAWGSGAPSSQQQQQQQQQPSPQQSQPSPYSSAYGTAWNTAGSSSSRPPDAYTTFETTQGAPRPPMRWRIGEQWLLFIVGWVLWPVWYIASIWYCMSREMASDPR